MKYLKKFNESTKSSIKIDVDELDLFNTQGALRNLISNDKISLSDNTLSFDKNDKESVDVLSNYFKL